MTSFYNIPRGLIRTLVEEGDIKSNVLLPYDPMGVMTEFLEKEGVKNIVSNQNEEVLYDISWWQDMREKKLDWVIATTMGSHEYTPYLLKYSSLVATEGMAFLDRISFLEPVKKRKEFLFDHHLQKLIVFSPRPKFSAIGNTRDSVTAAWFMFHRKQCNAKLTELKFALNWDKSQTLPSLA